MKVDDGKVGPTRATNAPPGSFAFSGHDRTHAHQILADPAGRFVLHVDLGLDKIYVWKFDAEKGVLAANDPPAVALPPDWTRCSACTLASPVNRGSSGS